MILALDLSSTSTGVCFDGETSTIAPGHTHPGDTLTFGCSGCIAKVRRDQLRARWAEQTDNDLYDLWLEHVLDEEDDRGLGEYLIERSVLTVDEVTAMYADMFDDEEAS